MKPTLPPALGPRVSALDAAGEAIEYTRGQLFPFQLERWLALGYVAPPPDNVLYS